MIVVELGHTLRNPLPNGGEGGEPSKTASRVRGRIETILDFARVKRLREGDNPAAWRGNLKLALPARSKMRRVAPDIARAQAEGTLALLADDHPTNRSLIVRQINMLGYAAESAENGIAALEKFQSGRFGIVITDCNMPEMNGYELTRRIRELEAASGKKRIPIIACTANALGGEAEICFAAGMDDFLVKPLSLEALRAALGRWTGPAAGPERSGCQLVWGYLRESAR